MRPGKRHFGYSVGFTARLPADRLDAIELFQLSMDEGRQVLVGLRQGLGSRYHQPGPLAGRDLEGTIWDFYQYPSRKLDPPKRAVKNRNREGGVMNNPDPELVATRCSEAEWQLRVQLAACYRAFVHYGWTDSIFTHLSARVPGQQRQYLINPYGLLFHEICASNLIKVDFDGNVIDGDYPYNEAGHAIHSAVLRARPEVNVALHSHTRAGMAVSCMRCGLLPLTQQANEIRDMVCYHEYGIARPGSDECERLGADMGDKWIMIMQNHGLLTLGRSVAEAFYYLYTVENACKVQVDVLASGGEPLMPAPGIVDELAAAGKARATESRQHVDLAWDAVLRMLDRQDPSFRE